MQTTVRAPGKIVLAFAVTVIMLALSVILTSCATTKSAATGIAETCADQVTPQVVRVVKDTAFSAVSADLEGLLKGFSICVALAAAQKAIDELDGLSADSAPSMPASTTPAVSPATARDRLARWRAAHPGPVSVLSERRWRFLSGTPWPFIPQRATC